MRSLLRLYSLLIFQSKSGPELSTRVWLAVCPFLSLKAAELAGHAAPGRQSFLILVPAFGYGQVAFEPFIRGCYNLVRNWMNGDFSGD